MLRAFASIGALEGASWDACGAVGGFMECCGFCGFTVLGFGGRGVWGFGLGVWGSETYT